jgi:hypothetical protein
MPSPAMIVAAVALFAALGGSSYAALAGHGNSGPACSRSKLEGTVLIGAKGSFSKHFKKESGFNCSGKAIEARRLGRGRYEVRFVGNPGKNAVGSVDDPKTEVDHDYVTFTRLGPGDFVVHVYHAVAGGSTTAGQERPLGAAAIASADVAFSIILG